jgi:hypothetical protein
MTFCTDERFELNIPSSSGLTKDFPINNELALAVITLPVSCQTVFRRKRRRNGIR